MVDLFIFLIVLNGNLNVLIIMVVEKVVDYILGKFLLLVLIVDVVMEK